MRINKTTVCLTLWLVFRFLAISSHGQSLSSSGLAGELRREYTDFAGAILVVAPHSGEIIGATNQDLLNTLPLPVGSLIKILTAYTYLQNPEADAAIEFSCPKSSRAHARLDTCWYAPGHGKLNLPGAIAHSCNYFFARLAERITYRSFLETLRLFEVIDEKGVATLETLSAQEQKEVMVGFGDALRVPPVRVLMAYLTLFNDGFLFESPTDLGKPASVLRRIYTPAPTLKILGDGMSLSAQAGSARKARVILQQPGLIAKTGTSPFVLDGPARRAKTHAWFIGLFPRTDPQIAVLVFCEQGTGANDAAAVGGRVLRLYLGPTGYQAP